MKIHHKALITSVFWLGFLHQSASAASNYNYSTNFVDFSQLEAVELLAKQASSKRIITTVTLTDIEEILQAGNFLYRRESSNTLRFDSKEYKIYVTLRCNDTKKGCPSALMQVRFRLSSRPSLNLVNEWNRTKAASRAYVDDNDAVVLESDLLALGGITTENLASQVIIFTASVESFAKHIGFN